MRPQTTTVELVLLNQRLRTGALLRVHRGVYRVGHRAPSVEARYLAAVWACGGEARLTGRAAAHLYRLASGPAPPPEVATPLKRRVDGVKVRRSRIDACDATIDRGIPITTVPRTLVDLAERDRRRERDARARGDEFRSYTWRDVCEDVSLMLADLRELLLTRDPRWGGARRAPPAGRSRFR